MTPEKLLIGVVAFITACRADTLTNEDLGGTTGSATETDTDSTTETDTTTDTETETTTDTETGDDPIPPECSDGIVDPDEECDDGNFVDDDGCTNACTLPLCGDAIVQANEACDAGPDNGPGQPCNASCQLNVCGDADVGPGESCDDGNAVDDDACPNNCILASCGNGVFDVGEECEDGDMDATDGCTNACLFPICGDGVTWAGHEACDDGNLIEDDECTTQCELASCGDDILQAGEECEDGNQQANDGCFQCLEQRVLTLEILHDATCVQLDTSAVRCWGNSAFGQLGHGNTLTIGDDEHPYAAGDLDPGGVVVELDSRGGHSCVRLEGGSVRCWGTNVYGELGYGNLEHVGDDEPAGSAGDVDVGGNVIQLAVGGIHTCVLLDTGSVRCWGAGIPGTLGYGNTDDIGDDELPSSVGDVDIGGTVVALRAGDVHTCALLDTGAVRCWGGGGGDSAGLGYGNNETIGDDESPASAGDVDVGGNVVDLSLGHGHTCALLDTGAVRCWGANNYGQLGYGHTLTIGDNEVPATAGDVPLGGLATQISAQSRHVCALLVGGTVRCWGYGYKGRLGYGNELNIGDNETPASVGDVNVGGIVESVHAGGLHTCVLLTTGVVRCWGWNQTGELGLANFDTIGDNEAPAVAQNVEVFG